MSRARHSPPDQSRSVFYARDNFTLPPAQVGLEVALIPVLLISGVLRFLVDILDYSAVVDVLVRNQERMLIHPGRVEVDGILSWLRRMCVVRERDTFVLPPTIDLVLNTGFTVALHIRLEVGVFRCRLYSLGLGRIGIRFATCALNWRDFNHLFQSKHTKLLTFYRSTESYCSSFTMWGYRTTTKPPTLGREFSTRVLKFMQPCSEYDVKRNKKNRKKRLSSFIASTRGPVALRQRNATPGQNFSPLFHGTGIFLKGKSRRFFLNLHTQLEKHCY